MNLILIRPCYPSFLRDRLFERKHEHAPHWLDPYIALREAAGRQGIEMHTWDQRPLGEADVILFQDFPAKKEVEAARRAAPRAKFVLQILESPLGRPHVFARANHRLFDAVVTYNPHLVDGRRYFQYFLPVGRPDGARPAPAFRERKPCVMINTNRNASWNGLLGHRQRGGLAGLPGLGTLFQGWRVPPASWWRQNRGELYSARRRLARTAERFYPGALEIYGLGWSGESTGWASRFKRPHAFSNHVPADTRDKLDILPGYRFCIAYENLRADVGYISEKILDAFLAGCVPIYLGDERITEHVPADSFIDARRFSSDRQIFDYVLGCPEEEWSRLRSSGERFLGSPAASLFFSPSFANRMMEILLAVAAPDSPPHVPAAG